MGGQPTGRSSGVDPPPPPEDLPGQGNTGYQIRHWEMLDYGLVRLPGFPPWIRGPVPPTVDSGRFISFIGSAHTFGPFCKHPFPALIEDVLSFPTLNLGFGGMNPERLLAEGTFIELANRGVCCVLQVMAARFAPNALLENANGFLLKRRDEPGAAPVLAIDQWRRILEECDRTRVLELVEESRAAWIAQYRTIFDRLDVPVVLLWFSEREPHYKPKFQSARAMFGPFPQLVNEAMVKEIRDLADDYVEVVAEARWPMVVHSRFTWKPKKLHDRLIDRSYPSAWMHLRCAQELSPALSAYVARSR